jgi:NhaA family Na+:H+ antiporter
VWVATLESGVHATVAGVVLGLMAPSRPLKAEAVAAAPLPQEATEAERGVSAGQARVAKLHLMASVPVTERLEHLLHLWTSFLVLPIFALANAGVHLASGDLTRAAQSSVSCGIAAGLVVGKAIGISGTSRAAIRLGAALPEGIRWRHVLGMSASPGLDSRCLCSSPTLHFQREPCCKRQRSASFSGRSSELCWGGWFCGLPRRNSVDGASPL